MALSVEVCRRLDLQLRGLDIAVHHAALLQLKNVFHLDGTANLSHDIRRLAMDIALDIAIGADHYLSRTVDIPYQGAVDTQIAVAGDVSLHSGPCADKAGALTNGCSAGLKGV